MAHKIIDTNAKEVYSKRNFRDDAAGKERSMFPYLPHTEQDVADMLKEIGIKNIGELFSDIPQDPSALEAAEHTFPPFGA